MPLLFSTDRCDGPAMVRNLLGRPLMSRGFAGRRPFAIASWMSQEIDASGSRMADCRNDGVPGARMGLVPRDSRKKNDGLPDCCRRPCGGCSPHRRTMPRSRSSSQNSVRVPRNHRTARFCVDEGQPYPAFHHAPCAASRRRNSSTSACAPAWPSSLRSHWDSQTARRWLISG